MRPVFAAFTIVSLLILPRLVAAADVASANVAAANIPAADADFFEKKIRPVLDASCYECHSARAKELQSKLYLDSREGLLKGGENGPAIVPGDPDKSRLLVAIGYGDVDLQMPPKRKLPTETVADLREWVRRGAPWPQSAADAHATTAEPAKPKFDLQARKAAHWAWKPLAVVGPPAVKDEHWPADPLDRFILAKLEAKGMAPAAAADRRTLIRRGYFDLIGLPPPPEEVERFVHDSSPDVWAKVVDQLLAAPQFGERWGRHWLDLVRYAETRGHEFDYPVPDAWQYRDWVIRALNADLPYNQFVTEQIAGDLVPNPRRDPSGRVNESVLGTGFWFLGEWIHSPVDIRQDETDRVDNQIDVMTKTFLGLTVGCARCHDHKFDAIGTKDYYALAGFLHSSSYREVRFESQAENHAVVEQIRAFDDSRRDVFVRQTVDGIKPALGRMADYLVAACEVIRGEANQPKADTKPAAEPAATDARVRVAADRLKLDPVLLAGWIKEIKAAAKDQFAPLHPWAILAGDAEPETPERLAKLLQPLAASWQADERRAAAPPLGAALVVDYGHPGPHDWLTDGLAFGDRPARAGEVRLLGGGQQVCEQGAAIGGVSGTDVPGMLRTPTFTVAAPEVWYRVRGSGQVVVVVDSLRMLQGPLHTGLQRHVDAGPRWSWQATNLHDYLGHRAHIEFTPDPKPQFFAVAQVMQANSAPPEPSRASQLLLAAIAIKPPASAAELAQRYQTLFSETVESLAAGHLADGTDGAARAPLANWLLEHSGALATAAQKPTSRIAITAPDFAGARAAIVARLKPSPTAMAMLDGSGVDEHVLIRGSHKTPGDLVPRRFLEAIAGPNQAPIEFGSGRLELARRMTDPSNPFISRVIVNRVWHHLFGRGIVATVDNFGLLGTPPTHPELLDSLADGFMRDGWSIKRLIRRVVLSRTYQLSSAASERSAQTDPQNLLWQHASIRRLEGEAIRDNILTVSGRLNRQSYGPSVEIFLTPFMEGRGRPASGPLDGDGRRSVYLRVRRNFLVPMLTAFDTPAPFSTVGRRSVSNLPAQALILLNDPFVVEQAHVWAKRVLAEKGISPPERIKRMYATAFAREPSEQELSAALEFLNQQGEQLGLDRAACLNDERTWADLCHVLFNVKEFIFVD